MPKDLDMLNNLRVIFTVSMLNMSYINFRLDINFRLGKVDVNSPGSHKVWQNTAYYYQMYSLCVILHFAFLVSIFILA